MKPQLPAELAPALAVVDAIDAALASGLSRIAPREQAGLRAMAATLGPTPLGPTINEAVNALIGGELLGHHLVALAAARASILGAAYDGLFEAAAGELGYRVAPEAPMPPPATPEPLTRTLMASAQQWLVEVALSGFAALDRQTMHPLVGALRPLQAHPPLARLAALLTGLSAELLEAAPTAAMTSLPLRRWCDLWTVSILYTTALPSPPRTQEVSGTLTVLGLDLRHHDHFVSAIVHAALQAEDLQLVRLHFSAWKVDAINGVEALTLLTPLAPRLFAAFTTPTSFLVMDLALSEAGDLTWNEDAAHATAHVDLPLEGALVHRAAPRDRHPIQLSLPFCTKSAPELPVAGASPWLELDDLFATRGATEFVGLLRWDDGWRAQPMVAHTKKGPKGLADALNKSFKIKDFALPVLRERASRLLRKS